MDEDSWKEWGKHVLQELSRLSGSVDGMREELKAIYGDVSALKVKAGLWGAICGAGAGAIPVLIFLVMEMTKGSSPF